MANIIYSTAKTKLLNGTVDLDTNTIKVMLVTSTYTPSAAHVFRLSITNEIVGAGYTAGGATLAGATVTTVGSTGVFDATDVTWSASTITAARGAVIYKSTGVATTDDLIGYVDFVTDQSSSNGDFTIQWNASGILVLN